MTSQYYSKEGIPMYEVISAFKDILDGKRYQPGDRYEGKTTQKRIRELTTAENKAGKPLIRKINAREE